MRFLEIREGLHLDVDKIEAIEDFGGGSKIYTTTGISYDSVFPRNVLVQIIEAGEVNNEDEVLEQLKLINNNHQYFNG
jgi:hypothetical protein